MKHLIKLIFSLSTNLYNSYHNNDNSGMLKLRGLNNINIPKKPVPSNPHFEALNKQYFNYIRGTVHRENIKKDELFVTKFTEPKKFADTFLRHAIILNTQHSDETKELYFKSKAYEKLLIKQSDFLEHPFIGQILYQTDNEIVLRFNNLTRQIYKTYYDKCNNKHVPVLKLYDNQGVSTSSLIIHLVKNTIDDKNLMGTNQCK
jgi:hypothetical protein